ncbi:ABC transporter ATP-binding protein [Paenibacillus sp. MER TA 81-3]|uniref:ABC transporter ATP-binding protein n=1 Tax=Paenibacillus sp. MER TA 81-3 TaxID=2939573 RepID=UPI00203D7966|nr:ABC transporter ATP-binding protein [Paenibacillus sp. MER TA 81-3]MCM3340108.1 ABC transporter ATP-binding protein [Paenibacillus sp. MER TA 81-3]
MNNKETISLQLNQICYAYGSKEILHEIDCTFYSGQITVLLGPNGAGKTTLLNLIAGLNQPQQGTISLNHHVLQWQDQRYKQRIGYLMEFPFYYPSLTVVEMMRLNGGLRNIQRGQLEDRIMHWLERFELQAYHNHQMDALSQGTKKRVALASTLLHEPDILILDEPTNGLDPDQVMIVRNTLQEYSENGALILLSTHIIGLAEKLAQQVAILRNGQLVYCGDSTDDLEGLYVAHR